MSFSLLPRFTLAAFLIAAAIPLTSQTVYHASEGKSLFSFGGGFSTFDPGFAQGPVPVYKFDPGNGYGRKWGATAWADARIPFGGPLARGFSIEAQYRSLFAGGLEGQQDLKESSIGGGAKYTWRHWNNVRPYGKYIFSIGKVSFVPVPITPGVTYHYDSRATNAFGGGLEIRFTEHIWARGDYEFQLWGPLLDARNLEPQGLTVGVMYNLGRSPTR
jgi:hypothetical protein